ncbi:MAG: hypothetical protein MJZ03_04340 [archaeon]|nr:hypothetical protein [archaeon]
MWGKTSGIISKADFMRNPFKEKELKDFTIEDCETYLNNYEYGEHESEVKNRLRDLKDGTIKPPKEIEEETEENLEDLESVEETEENLGDLELVEETEENNEKEKVGDKILRWIGLIVIVLVCGTIVILVLEAIIPEGTGNFIYKYRYIIYPAGLALGRWIDGKK